MCDEEAIIMATSSIYNELRIKDKRSCENLLRTLESSKSAKVKPVVMSKKVHTVRTAEDFVKIFGDK